jgi:D-amino-acid dehydrogenase
MSDDGRIDVLVIGGGAIGVASAHELARRGAEVVVLEAREVLGAECSYGNAGLVAPSHCIPLARPGLVGRILGWLRPGGAVYIKPSLAPEVLRFGFALLRSCGQERMLRGLRALRDLSRASLDLFEELVLDGLEFGYRRDGLMNVCATGRAFELLVEDARLLEREGFDPEILGAAEARRRVPALADGISGGVYWREDAHCEPARFVAQLGRAAQREGARFELETRATGFRHGAPGVIEAVETDRGVFRARTIVLAAGSWTPALARRLGARVPIVPGKGYHVHARKSTLALPMPLIFQEHVFAATPMDGGLRLAGTMDFVGFDLTLPEMRARRLAADAARYLRGIDDLGELEIWCGLRPVTPDSLPILGPSTRIPNLVYATGHAMLGITLAPVSGRAVAELALGEHPSVDIDLLAPGRYGL